MTVIEPITAYREDPGVNFSGPHEWSLVRTGKVDTWIPTVCCDGLNHGHARYP